MYYRLLTIKGAPEVLMNRIGHYAGSSGVTLKFDASTRTVVESTKDKWSAEGRRVILLARKVISADSIPTGLSSIAFEGKLNAAAQSGLTLVGIVGIADPPRPEIPDVVRTLRRAGIRIFMVRFYQNH
jgi:sodium/potassium-transporting ATPase subunit alpha